MHLHDHRPGIADPARRVCRQRQHRPFPDGQSALSCDPERTLLAWNVRRFAPPKAAIIKLSAAEREAAWADLLFVDGVAPHRAIDRFAADRAGTIVFLQGRLAAPAQPTEQRLKELIQGLGSDPYAVRASATRELERLNEQAEPGLQESLKSEGNLQRRRSLESLLARAADDQRPECLRECRAIEVLEKIDARELLAESAHGPANARLTREASAALFRLRVRSAD